MLTGNHTLSQTASTSSPAPLTKKTSQRGASGPAPPPPACQHCARVLCCPPVACSELPMPMEVSPAAGVPGPVPSPGEGRCPSHMGGVPPSAEQPSLPAQDTARHFLSSESPSSPHFCPPLSRSGSLGSSPVTPFSTSHLPQRRPLRVTLLDLQVNSQSPSHYLISRHRLSSSRALYLALKIPRSAGFHLSVPLSLLAMLEYPGLGPRSPLKKPEGSLNMEVKVCHAAGQTLAGNARYLSATEPCLSGPCHLLRSCRTVLLPSPFCLPRDCVCQSLRTGCSLRLEFTSSLGCHIAHTFTSWSFLKCHLLPGTSLSITFSAPSQERTLPSSLAIHPRQVAGDGTMCLLHFPMD